MTKKRARSDELKNCHAFARKRIFALMSSYLSLSFNLPAATHNRVYIPNAYHTYLSNEEIMHRVYWLNKLLNVNQEDFKNNFDQNDWIYLISNCQYHFNKRSDLNVYRFPPNIENKIRNIDPILNYPNVYVYLPENLREKFLQEYINFNLSEKPSGRIDYLVISKHQYLNMDKTRLVYENRDYMVYKLENF